MLALTEWDDGAYKLVMAELGGCEFCLRDALGTVLHLYSNRFALDAGSLAKAADYLVDELERLLMPSEDQTDRMAQLDRQNRINKRTTSENHNPTTE